MSRDEPAGDAFSLTLSDELRATEQRSSLLEAKSGMSRTSSSTAGTASGTGGRQKRRSFLDVLLAKTRGDNGRPTLSTTAGRSSQSSRSASENTIFGGRPEGKLPPSSQKQQQQMLHSPNNGSSKIVSVTSFNSRSTVVGSNSSLRTPLTSVAAIGELSERLAKARFFVAIPQLSSEEWDDFLVHRMPLHWGLTAVGLFAVLYKGFTAMQHSNNGYTTTVIFDVIIMILAAAIAVLDSLRNVLCYAGKLTEYNARLWGNAVAVLSLWTMSGILLRYEHVECWAIGGNGPYLTTKERVEACLSYYRVFLLSFAVSPLIFPVGFRHILCAFTVSAIVEAFFMFWLNPPEMPRTESGARLMLVVFFSIAQGAILYHRQQEDVVRFIVSRQLQQAKREHAERARQLVHLLQSIAPPQQLLHVLRHGNQTDESLQCSILVIQVPDFNVWLSAREPPRRAIVSVDVLVAQLEKQRIRFGVEKLFFRADTYVTSWGLRTITKCSTVSTGTGSANANDDEGASPHDPTRLGEFALAVSHFLQSWSGAPCQLGLGTGPCKGAVIASPKLSYILCGEAHDLASQAASFAKPKGVVASRLTVECCRRHQTRLTTAPVKHQSTVCDDDPNSSSDSAPSYFEILKLAPSPDRTTVPKEAVHAFSSADDEMYLLEDEGAELLPLALKHYRKPTDGAVYARLAGVLDQRERATRQKTWTSAGCISCFANDSQPDNARREAQWGDRTHFWEHMASKAFGRRLLVLSTMFTLICWMVASAILTETLTVGGICCSVLGFALQAAFAFGGHRALAQAALAYHKSSPLRHWSPTRRLVFLDCLSTYVQIVLLILGADLMEVSAANRHLGYLLFASFLTLLEASAGLPWWATLGYFVVFQPSVLTWRVASGKQDLAAHDIAMQVALPVMGFIMYVRERQALFAFFEEIETVARVAVAECEKRVHEELLTTLIPPYIVDRVLEKRESSRWGCITESLGDVALLQVRFHCTTLEEQLSATNLLGKLATVASQGSEVDLVSLDGDTAVVGGPLRHPEINSLLDWKNTEKSVGNKWFVSQRRLAGEGQANHSSYVLGAIVADLLFRFRDRPNLLSCVLHRAEALVVVLGMQQPRFSLLGMVATTSTAILNAASQGTVCATESFSRSLPGCAPQHIPQQVQQEMVSASFSGEGIVTMVKFPELLTCETSANSGDFPISAAESANQQPPELLGFPLFFHPAMRWRCRGCPILYVHPVELPHTASPDA